MEKILVSACLLGKRVRYDGNALSVADQLLDRWREEGRIVAVCPEVDSGMSVPRAPAEILGGAGGDVLSNDARVIDNTGEDVTDPFIAGAKHALQLCDKYQLRVALLTESSPSCGSHSIYDGQFSGHKISGPGVTTALLRQHGIQVFNQHEIAAAHKALTNLQA